MQSESRMLGNAAASPAAHRWSGGFLAGLRANGIEHIHVGHEPFRLWPYGPMRVRPAKGGRPGRVESLAYTNLPRLRERGLARSYEQAVIRTVAASRPDLLVSYNAELFVRRAARAAVSLGVPWVPIVMDGDDRMLEETRSESWNGMRQAVAGAKGIAFLSHWAYSHAPFASTFHMDGGIDASRMLSDPPKAGPPVVLYTGTKGPWGGLDLLLAAWAKVRQPNAVLWVSGQGEHAGLAAATATDPRIRDFGLVEESRLQQLVEQAAILVNPRPPSYQSNRLNFPSKIFEYLATGKPIVSTRTLSFGPGYEDVLMFAEESPDALAAAIDGALSLSPADRLAHRERVARFAARHGDWATVVERFLAWAADPADSRCSAHG